MRYVENGDLRLRHPDVEEIERAFLIKDNLLRASLGREENLNASLGTAKTEIDQLTQTIQQSGTDCQKTVNDLNGKVSVLNEELLAKKDANLALMQQIEQLKLNKDKPALPEATMEKLLGYYEKYPEANIFSSSHYFGKSHKAAEIFIQDWATIGTGLREFGPFITGANAWVWRIMAEETGGDLHKACDISIARLACATPVNYVYDEQGYGTDDYWAFAPETHFNGFGDCDDYAAYRYVLNRTAGVPDLLMRIMNGNTRGSGDGHSTNAYYCSDGGWRHLNSTTTFKQNDFKSISQAPSIHDADDRFGLKFIWYSYNADKSWQGIVTDEQESAIERSRTNRLLRKVRIVPHIGREENA